MHLIDRIKELDKNLKIPSYPKPPYNDQHPVILQRKENMEKLNSTVAEFSEIFKIHLEEDIPESLKVLDFSPESLGILDDHFYRKGLSEFLFQGLSEQ